MPNQPKIIIVHPRIPSSLDPKVENYFKELQRDLDSFVYNLNKLLLAMDGALGSGGVGSLAPIMASADGTLWQIGVHEDGSPFTTRFLVSGVSQDLIMKSPDTTTWQIFVNNDGDILTTTYSGTCDCLSTVVLVAEEDESRWGLVVGDDGSVGTQAL